MALKQTVLTLARACGLGVLARRATASHLRILCYHGLWVTPGYAFGDCTFISPEQFESRMERLKRSGLLVLPLDEAVDRLAEGTLPEAAVAITIDDGWVSTLTHMLPVLERLELPATLYATTWYSGRELPVVNMVVRYLIEASGRTAIDPASVASAIDTLPLPERLDALRSFGREVGIDEAWLDLRQFNIMSPGEFAQAQQRGLDIQLHTHRHIDVHGQVERLPRELIENRQFLARAIGQTPLTHFCYPSGTFHPQAPALLAAAGIRSATMVEPGVNAPGSDPYRLRRLLDGRRLTDVEFDAYLSGLLHFGQGVRNLVVPRRRAARSCSQATALQGQLAAAE